MNKKSTTKNTLYVIIVVSVIAVFGIVFGIIIPRTRISGSGGNTSFMSVPTIKSAVVSASTGESHNVVVDFHLEVDKSGLKTDAKSLEAQLMEIVSQLDYDQVSGADSVEYIKGEVREQLSETVSDGQIKNIYITHLESGNVRISVPATTPEPSSRRDDVLKALFPNIK